jgi:hypothetical protein
VGAQCARNSRGITSPDKNGRHVSAYRAGSVISHLSSTPSGRLRPRARSVMQPARLRCWFRSAESGNFPFLGGCLFSYCSRGMDQLSNLISWNPGLGPLTTVKIHGCPKGGCTPCHVTSLEPIVIEVGELNVCYKPDLIKVIFGFPTAGPAPASRAWLSGLSGFEPGLANHYHPSQ